MTDDPILGSGEILLAEDSPVQAELLRRSLQRHGYRAVVVRDGREALAYVRSHQPTMLISDVGMPGMDGYELCRQIKSDPDLRHMPVILLTSFTDPSDILRGLHAGADNYLPKPYEEAELLSRVGSLLTGPVEQAQEESFGLEVTLDGQNHLVTSNRQQILSLLLSTAEKAVRQNRELIQTQLELKRANEELAKANFDLEHANKAKSEFLANMSHELRAPLNAVIGFSEILLDPSKRADDRTTNRFLQHIATAGKHLLTLINDILDLSKVEAGSMELYPEAFDIVLALEGIQAIIEPLALKKGQELKLIVDPELTLMTQDARRFKQVLYNLLSNANKYTREAGEITTRAARTGEFIQVSVSDTGIGIPAEDLEKVFEEFKQLDSGYARKQQGTGLGLGLTRGLVRAMGGDIWVDSVVEKGSTFTFRLPLNWHPQHPTK